jgi:hypothetical protein
MKPTLYFLTRENPFPPAGGAHLRDSTLIEVLKNSFDVEILCHTPTDSTGKVDELAIRIGDESTPAGVKVTRLERDPPALWEKVISTLRPMVKNHYSVKMEEALRKRAKKGRLLGSPAWRWRNTRLLQNSWVIESFSIFTK